MIAVRAPGKLMVVGEYAVLAGAPALMLAVDREVEVRLSSETPGEFSASPLDARVQFRVQGERWEWDDPQAAASALGDTAELAPAWVACLAHDGGALPSFSVTVDSGALYSSAGGRPVKLGLGSSAAVTAALGLGLWRLAQPDAPADAQALFRRLLPVYRKAAGGGVSGADLAASMFGGMPVFEDASGGPEIRPGCWPASLAMATIWTGQAASTGAGVEAFHAWRGAAGSRSRTLLADMKTAARQVIECIRLPDTAGLRASLARWRELLETLDSELDGRILTAPHRALEALADRCGVIYKSCGAGGGDVGLALAEDPEALERFRALARAAGYHPVELQPAGEGARCIAG